MLQYRISPIAEWQTYSYDESPVCFCDVLHLLFQKYPSNVVEVRPLAKPEGPVE